MRMELLNKSVIVTGANHGIGAAIAKSLASFGANVAVNYHNSKDKAEEVLSEIRTLGGEGFIFKADVTNKGESDALVEETIKHYGRVDVLVCNAAIGFPMKSFTEHAWEEAEKKITDEMKAIFFPVQAALKDMMKRKSGKIILISSTLSRSAGEGFFSQCAAKAALDSTARVLAKELGPHGIKVNVVAPGLTETDAIAGFGEGLIKAAAEHTPLKRIGQPKDAAGAVVFLASVLGDFITGQYIPVSGGSYMP